VNAAITAMLGMREREREADRNGGREIGLREEAANKSLLSSPAR
jgi:hypothetical protein